MEIGEIVKLGFYRKQEIGDQLRGMKEKKEENAGNEAAIMNIGRTAKPSKPAHVLLIQ